MPRQLFNPNWLTRATEPTPHAASGHVSAGKPIHEPGRSCAGGRDLRIAHARQPAESAAALGRKPDGAAGPAPKHLTYIRPPQRSKALTPSPGC